MHTFAHVDAQAIYLQLTTERTGRWKTSLDQLQMCASNANVMSLSKWSSSSVSITAWVERFSWQLFGPGCSAFSLLFREAHLFLLGPIISRAPLMVLLRVTKCTECGDDGTDGWGLARAYWGLSVGARASPLATNSLPPHSRAIVGLPQRTCCIASQQRARACGQCRSGAPLFQPLRVQLAAALEEELAGRGVHR
jgi:hypothetical protein